MIVLPNEIIIHIYSFMSFEDLLLAHITIFPFLLTKKIKNQNKNFSYHSMWRKAAKNSDLYLLNCLRSKKISGCLDSVSEVAKNGDMRVINWYHIYYKSSFKKHTVEQAAIYGCLEVIKFINHHKNYSKLFTKNTMDCAAMHGHLDIVKFLYYNRTEGCTKRAMFWAISNGHFEVVKFLHINLKIKADSSTLCSAVYTGNVDLVKYIYENKCCTNIKNFVKDSISTAKYNKWTEMYNYLKSIDSS